MSLIASTILMVRPACFGYNTETAANNVFQSQVAHGSTKEVQKAAVEEFDEFIKTLKKNKIDVIVIQDTPMPVKPDAVFPNNWFSTMPGGKLIVYPMFAINRRIEKRDDLLQQLHHEYKVTDFQDWSEFEAEGFFLEGTGSMIIDHNSKLIFACLSDRTHKSLLDKFAAAHGYRAVSFSATDEKGSPVYHTNVIMHLGESYAVICLDSIKDGAERIGVQQLLIASGHEVIPISFEQVRAYAGNMLQVKNSAGKKITILSKSAYKSLTKEQKEILEIHTDLLPIDISTIETIGGGSVRCMMAEIFLEKK
ncbi:citrulline utilization hydrolase CtlX [Foetidibacter luteolus]|uniref:citrulline utilization hydrolase CtlX n=1 Tax=Foetidibacter luteolus TaxID=2608880 RepID=UPI001A9820C7|nr:arginine deiminase-related protein [Foetidibacter luteolus]